MCPGSNLGSEIYDIHEGRSTRIGRPRQEDAFVEAARLCVAASRAGAGVLHYDLWRGTEGEQRYVLDDPYVDDAVAAHMASNQFKAFGLAARDLEAAQPIISKMLAIDVAD